MYFIFRMIIISMTITLCHNASITNNWQDCKLSNNPFPSPSTFDLLPHPNFSLLLHKVFLFLNAIWAYQRNYSFMWIKMKSYACKQSSYCLHTNNYFNFYLEEFPMFILQSNSHSHLMQLSPFQKTFYCSSTQQQTNVKRYISKSQITNLKS